MKKIRVRLLGSSEANVELKRVAEWALQQKLAEISFETSGKLTEVLNKTDNNFNVCRLFEDFQVQFFNDFRGLPAELRSLGRVDTVLNVSGVLWPKNFLKKSFHEVVLLRCPSLDNSSEAIILGVDYYARVAVKVLTELGFSKISVVAEDSLAVDAFINTVKKNYLGLAFNGFNLRELVLQAGVNSVCVNTLVFQESSSQLTDILYFNYLKPGGFVANFASGPYDQQGNDLLLVEAGSVNSPVASPWDLTLGLELLWLDALLNASGRVYLQGLAEIKN